MMTQRTVVRLVFVFLLSLPVFANASSDANWETNDLVGYARESDSDVLWFQSCNEKNPGCSCMENGSDEPSEVLCLSKLVIRQEGKPQWFPGVETNVDAKRLKELRSKTKRIDLGEIWGNGKRQLEYKDHFLIKLTAFKRSTDSRKFKLKFDIEGEKNPVLKPVFFRLELAKNLTSNFFNGLNGYFLPDCGYVVLHPNYLVNEPNEQGMSANWLSIGVIVFKLEHPVKP